MGDDQAALPAGTVTFVLGDVVGSTRLWEEYAGEMPSVLARLDQIIDERLGAHRGARPAEQGEGDNFVAVFARADAAASFALHVAGAIAGECWPGDIRVALRTALHTGDARVRDGGVTWARRSPVPRPSALIPRLRGEDAGHLPC